MLRIAEYTKRVSELKEKTREAFLKTDVDVQIRDSRFNTIRLVFAGQYSAGKSSIVKMLTGREDIVIDADITTQEAHTYEWQGLEIVDTPGIHTQLRPDHDEISYKAIASADMLVFVITNELFDTYIADHFRKLAIDKDKAGEMILVVNKMDRTSQGNTSEQQAIILEDLKKVIAPYTPEQLNLSFLDAKSYLESLKERAEDPEYADELLEQSGYSEFIETLNQFVSDKEIPSKLTTDLYIIDDCLERAIKELQPKSDDSDIDALEESLLQQRHLLIEARGRMQQEVKDIYTTSASKIRDLGLDAANLLVEGCRQEDVEQELQKYIRSAEDEIEKCQEKANTVLDARLNEMVNALVKNPVDDQKFFEMKANEIDGIPVYVNRAGFTGEKLGYELYFPKAEAPAQEEKLRALAPNFGGREVTEFQVMAWTLPCEAGFYYMRDLRHTNPYEVGLANGINFDKDFIGKEALMKIRDEGPAREVVGFTVAEDNIHIKGRHMGNEGEKVFVDGEEIGRVMKIVYSYVNEINNGLIICKKGVLKDGDHVSLHGHDAVICGTTFLS